MEREHRNKDGDREFLPKLLRRIQQSCFPSSSRRMGNEQEGKRLVTCSALASIPVPRSFGKPWLRQQPPSREPAAGGGWVCLLAPGWGRCLLAALLPHRKQRGQQVYLY